MNFDWSVWGTPLMVLGAGAALGALLLWNRAGDAERAQAEGVMRDLEREHEAAVEALKMLETERDKMDPAAYEAERKALLARGAAALRALDEARGKRAPNPTRGADVSDDLTELVARLRAERDRVGDEAFDAALRVATGRGAPPAEPEGMSPVWRGAITASAVWALVALLVVFAGEQATPRGDGSMTGGTTMGRGAPPPQPAGPGGGAPSFEAMAAPLEARLKENPQDLDALNELTQLALSAGDAQRAMEYNQRAAQIAPDDPDVGASKAVLAAMVGMIPRALEILQGVVEAHPEHARAVTYMGLLLMEDGRYEEAVPWLEKAVALQPGVVPLQQALDAARRGEPLPGAGGPPPAAPSPAPADAGEVVIQGTLELAPGASADGAQLVFVSVRAPEGGPPLAAKKLPADRFPLTFEITTADAISMGGAPRPFPAQMSVSARLDADGNAMTREPLPSAGAGGVARGTTGLTLTLE